MTSSRPGASALVDCGAAMIVIGVIAAAINVADVPIAANVRFAELCLLPIVQTSLPLFLPDSHRREDFSSARRLRAGRLYEEINRRSQLSYTIQQIAAKLFAMRHQHDAVPLPVICQDAHPIAANTERAARHRQVLSCQCNDDVREAPCRLETTPRKLRLRARERYRFHNVVNYVNVDGRISYRVVMTGDAMKKTISNLLALSLAAGAGTALAEGNAEAGESKAELCSACHGLNGISESDAWPNLAGQKAAYLAKQLRAYRDGTRRDPSMDAMAKSLSDEDIENLAAYYAQLRTQ
jgi:cytochrome c553